MQYAVVLCTVFSFSADAQTKANPQKPPPPSKKEARGVQGFAVAPMILSDEGCSRDYVRAFQSEGVEFRKKIADLVSYGCLDTTAKAIFSAVAIDRKDFAVEKDMVANFRLVAMAFDLEHTQIAVGGPQVFVFRPARLTYNGWIPEKNFYAVTTDVFTQLLNEKKISMVINAGGALSTPEK
jgi:hypothetical protein